MSPRPDHQPALHESLPPGSKQRTRLHQNLLPRSKHGGQESQGKRKTARPFTPKAPVYVVLKSSRAKGSWSLLHRKNKAKVLSMVYVYAERFKVRVYRVSNVGNHLHLLVRAQEKKHLQDYLRVLAGRIAVTVTGARKFVKSLDPNPHAGPARTQYRRKFWDYLCWSRMVSWGRDFYSVSREILVNPIKKLTTELQEWGAPIPEVNLRGG